MYSTICVEWADHFGLSLTRKTIYTFSLSFPVGSHLGLLTFTPQICSLVTLYRRCVSTELEISTAFLFRETQRPDADALTDGQGATLNALPREGRIIIFQVQLRVAVKAHSSKSKCRLPARNMHVKRAWPKESVPTNFSNSAKPHLNMSEWVDS